MPYYFVIYERYRLKHTSKIEIPLLGLRNNRIIPFSIKKLDNTCLFSDFHCDSLMESHFSQYLIYIKVLFYNNDNMWVFSPIFLIIKLTKKIGLDPTNHYVVNLTFVSFHSTNRSFIILVMAFILLDSN